MSSDEPLPGAPGPGGDPSGDLDELIARYVDRLTEGELLDPDAIRAKHPGIADKLLRSLEAFVEAAPRSEGRPPLGTLGDYILRRQIGRGGMGVVYEAWETSMDRRVALKVLPGGVAADEKAFLRFLREARTAGQLSHPNVVHVYAMGVKDQTPYYAMEYVEGETLAQILARMAAPDSAGATGGDGKGEGEGEGKPGGGRQRSWWRRREATEEEAVRRLSPIVGLFRKPERGKGARPIAAEPIATDAVAAEETKAEAGARPAPAETVEVPAGGARPQPTAAATCSRAGVLEAQEITALYAYQVAAAFAEVADGLHHAHSRGITHRDIKPSNLILDREGRLRILDFGLAHLEGQESITGSGDLVGTVLYMSPEQAMARRIPVDHRTDVYSLGATLYEMLTWSPPHRGRTSQETLSHIVLRDPQPLRRLNPRIPRDLETIVLKCLRKDPFDRYGTAEALAQDLRRFLQGDPVEARPQASLERLARRAWRSRAKVGVACLAGLLVFASAILLYSHRRALHEARLEAYGEKVLGAIGKMELGRPARHEVDRGRPAVLERSGSGQGGPGAAAYAAEAVSVEAVPDPMEEAREALEEASRLLPGRPEAHLQLARCEELLGREKESRAALERALACDPGFLPALILRESLPGRSGEEVARAVEGALGALGESREDLRVLEASLAAYEAKEKGRWKEAAAAYGKVLSISPAGPEPYLGFRVGNLLERGRARLEAGDEEGALEDFAAARALRPELAEPVLLLGRMYLQRKDAIRAEERFEEFHATARRRDDFALNVAWLYHDLKEHERQVSWAERAAESSERERCLADAAWHQGRLDEALQAAKKAVGLDPENAWAHDSLGIVLRDQGKLDGAIAEHRRAIEIDPTYALAHNHLGIALRNQEKLDEAISEYRNAIEIDPTLASAHFNLGNVLAKQGKLDEAIAEFRKGIEIDPKSALGALTHGNLGVALREQGKLDEAIPELRRAIEIDPKFAPAHFNLANALHNQGKLDEAIAELRRAIETDPTYALAHYNLGCGLAEQGKLEDAIAEYRMAIDLDPRRVETHVNLGVSLERQGKQDEAIAEYRKGIDLDPRKVEADVQLGNSRERQGKRDGTVAASQRADEIYTEQNIDIGRRCLADILRRLKRLPEAFSAACDGIRVGRDGLPRYEPFLSMAIEILRETAKEPVLGPEIGPFVEALERCLLVDRNPPLPAYRALALALIYPSNGRDPRKAMEWATLAVKAKGGRDPGALALLAEIQAAAGDPASAVRTMEKAVDLTGALPEILSKLGEHRRAVLPDLPTYASIDAALEEPVMEVFAAEGTEWRFFRGKAEPSPALEWTRVDFDDSLWEEGRSGFGYEDGDDATILEDMKGGYTTIYIRRAFDLEDPGSWSRLILRVRADDGCVAYLNGTEVGRVRVGGEAGSRLAHDALATGNAPEPLEAVELPADRGLLRRGRNVVAIQGLNAAKDSSDLSLLPELRGERDRTTPEFEGLQRKKFEAFEALARERGREEGLKYLEARRLQRKGAHAEAAARLEDVLAKDGESAEPHLRLAECFLALGKPEEAEARLARALDSGRGDSRTLSELWFRVAAVDLKRPMADLVEFLEKAGRAAAESPLEDVRWVLERLAADGAVRLNCGGEEHMGPDGLLWGKDRFFASGHPFFGDGAGGATGPFKEPIEGTEDDPLYQTERWFPAGGVPPPGYRIPLPPGRYRVVLHFAEIWYREPGRRRFDVLLEGKKVLEGCEPKIHTAERYTFEEAVEDGRLDLEFVPWLDQPKISAIAIEVLR